MAISRASSAYVTVILCVRLILVTGNNELSVPANARCSCPGELLVFTCTAMGAGVTLWRGTAFNCPEILLRHSQYASGGSGASGTCNNGAIAGQGLQNVVNNNFISQLNITVSAALNRGSVECAYNDGQRTSRIGLSTLTVITDQYQPLEFVRLTAVSSEHLTFEWTPVSPGCPAISYSITTSNCGSCSNSTNMTRSVCSPPQLSTTAMECIFTIQSMACGVVFMDPVFVTLKVPDIPSIIYIPQYNTEGDLMKLTLNIIESSFLIAAGLNSSIQFYTLMATVDGQCTTSNSVSDFTCVDGICSFEVTFPLSSCPSSSPDTVSVSVSSTNQLGSGPSSDTYTIGGSNQFVVVSLDFSSNTFTCSFLNQLDTTAKLCSISYGFNPQQLTYTANGSSDSFTVTLPLHDDVKRERLVYFIVTASNNTFTLSVEGSQNQNLDLPSELDVTAVVCGVIFGLVLCGAVILVIITLLFLYKKKKKRYTHNTELSTELKDDAIALHPSTTPTPSAPSTDQPLSSQPRFIVLEVDNDCELKEFVEKKDLTFKRGCCFYQFTHDVEKIGDDQEIVLRNKKTREFITGTKVYDKLCGIVVHGEEVQQPCLSKYTVFVQSKGSGARHLSANSLLLYEAPSSIGLGTPKEPLLMPVLKGRILFNQLAESLTLQQFCKKHGLNFQSDSVFLDIQILKKCNKTIRDVILLDESDPESHKLFTGPKAKVIAEEIKQAMDSEDSVKHAMELNSDSAASDAKMLWRIFVSCKFPGDLFLDEGTLVLRKNTLSTPQKFITLQVALDRDYVQMSKFVESKDYKFHNGRAYYEFVREEEDILDDTDVVLMDKTTGGLLSGPDALYQIPQAPDTQIKRPNLTKYRVFVQSKSQGSRCLRAGDTILYKL